MEYDPEFEALINKVANKIVEEIRALKGTREEKLKKAGKIAIR